MLAYEGEFINLSHFTDNMLQTEERKARMFEKVLRLQFQRFLVSQRLHTLRKVVDSARASELKDAATQGTREMISRPMARTVEKGKGKRPFASLEQRDVI